MTIQRVARQSYQHHVVPDDPRSIPAYLKKEVQQIERSGAHISIQTQTVNYLVSGADETVLMDTTLGALTATLPIRVDEALNFKVTIKNVGANNLTIIGTVDGVAGITLTQWQAVTIASDAVAYFKIGEVL